MHGNCQVKLARPLPSDCGRVCHTGLGKHNSSRSTLVTCSDIKPEKVTLIKEVTRANKGNETHSFGSCRPSNLLFLGVVAISREMCGSSLPYPPSFHAEISLSSNHNFIARVGRASRYAGSHCRASQNGSVMACDAFTALVTATLQSTQVW